MQRGTNRNGLGGFYPCRDLSGRLFLDHPVALSLRISLSMLEMACRAARAARYISWRMDTTRPIPVSPPLASIRIASNVWICLSGLLNQCVAKRWTDKSPSILSSLVHHSWSTISHTRPPFFHLFSHLQLSTCEAGLNQVVLCCRQIPDSLLE
ncbi:hypothetical protein EV356DRAFT_164500 [Viridothelium virens]|uniref:Uncharacterized protein n=1 Tax=Viridothelium virens TaxID=1048519 RepID=A0A6A6HM01_VIRVR|nr:hypothetical protein EV356DRAFT_164500 [Viridothelium virens]